MKKIVKITALCLALACLMSISAFAAGTDAKKGICSIQVKENLKELIGIECEDGTPGTIDGVAVTDAEKLTLTYSAANGAVSGAQYLVLLLSGATGAPTESNIAYVDQKAADATGVEFTIFPNELKKGDYRIILTCANDQKVGVDTPVATFEYKQAYKLGDVNEDEKINATDALWILQNAAEKRIFGANQVLAADVNKDQKVNATDALWVLQAAVEKRVF